MAIKTTEQIFNQKAVFKNKAEFADDVTLGKNAEVDGNLQVNGDVVDESGNEKYISTGNEEQKTAWKRKTITCINGSQVVFNESDPYIYMELIHGNDRLFLYSLGVIQNSNRNARLEMGYGRNGIIAITSDIPSLYHHFISLTVRNDSSKFFFFEAVTTDSTPINSTNDLFTKLGNNDYIGNGISGSTLHSIHIGTRLEDTYFRLDGGSSNIMSLMVSSLGNLVTDNVTAISVSPSASAKEGPVWNEEEEEETPSEPTPKKSKAKSK